MGLKTHKTRRSNNDLESANMVDAHHANDSAGGEPITAPVHTALFSDTSHRHHVMQLRPNRMHPRMASAFTRRICRATGAEISKLLRGE